MIFFEKNNSKVLFISLAVFLFAGFIFYQYFQFNPLGKISFNNLTLLPEIDQIANQQFSETENSLQADLNYTDNIKIELEKEQDKQELLEQARQYLGEKMSSQEASSSEEEIKN